MEDLALWSEIPDYNEIRNASTNFATIDPYWANMGLTEELTKNLCKIQLVCK